MSGRDAIGTKAEASVEEQTGAALLRPLVEARPASPARDLPLLGIVIGELIGIKDEGRTPLVLYPGQSGSAALAARTTIDLHGPHVGSKVALMFENGDSSKPIVMGVLREGDGWPLAERPGQVEIDIDGERLIVAAREQVVLRCGKASITLTQAGKVLIQGTYVSSSSSGVNRIKGGSVQLN